MLKWFRGNSGQTTAEGGREARPRSKRHSTALKELNRNLAREENISILDLGATSAANISLFTGKGMKLCTEDLIAASGDPELQIKDPDGNPTYDLERFLKDNLAYELRSFDAVLFWDIADYLPEPLVKPVIERICSLMKPGGYLLAFFHTKDAGPDSPYSRYHITGDDALDVQPIARKGSGGYYKLLRVFNNRHIENLFRDFSSLKFFLARDNMREVLIVR
ncbi:MAG TPA: methyltransferase domain-containing protein [Terriglobales bacterium]|nr:methyltransferase domain-containing protein [Terriglobales bacterium]